jgi:peptidoglycan hydrolase-like protein with peptidoglycan-binding domain
MMKAAPQTHLNTGPRVPPATGTSRFQETTMKKLLTASLAALALLCLSPFALAQNPSPAAPAAETGQAPKKKRGPVFRANREQVTMAQTLLKRRGFYAGEATGKLDEATRAGLRKYQEAEGIKVTGTLNALTLEKMGIQLTEKQKAVVAAPKTT